MGIEPTISAGERPLVPAVNDKSILEDAASLKHLLSVSDSQQADVWLLRAENLCLEVCRPLRYDAVWFGGNLSTLRGTCFVY